LQVPIPQPDVMPWYAQSSPWLFPPSYLNESSKQNPCVTGHD
jgi:hypothetical protein